MSPPPLLDLATLTTGHDSVSMCVGVFLEVVTIVVCCHVYNQFIGCRQPDVERYGIGRLAVSFSNRVVYIVVDKTSGFD